ncbi:hypothetical protein [Clostridium felsineum]|uniref:Uncharacterized protein n=1 Tax=Clostridium felsineum TaxID=36839 RepID=A0A1S8L1N7_9CLOT|nr:hypothetical protein [Clostridium felsineum]URZ09253.1 hypothetical protein CLROS_046690 [Clostridium felsineum]URZ13939.1 hypothetical protein CROST_047170 [Clostridium felsineum]
MDIISMQIANRLQKKMKEEYGGMYEVFTATEGQTTFTSKESFMKEGHTLKVFVDGALAIDDEDYSKKDANTIVFTKGLQAGNIVLLTTEVVGVPKFENPSYDDTTLKNLIATKADEASLKTVADEVTLARGDSASLSDKLVSITSSIPKAYDDTSLKNQVQGIITALDDNKDGSITDTIANLKAQWEAADGDLKKLVDNKAEEADLTKLSSAVDGIKTSVASKADATSLKSVADEVTAARGSSASLAERINSISTGSGSGYDDTALKNLIAAKADEADFTKLSSTVSDIKTSVASKADEASLKSVTDEITTARGESTSLSDKLVSITASIPKAYDDTSLKNQVQGIITALDDNKDGSITDTIGNLKAQWEAADGDLKKLITNKAEEADLTKLSSTVDDIKTSVASKADASSLKSVTDEVTLARGDSASLSDKLVSITKSIPSSSDISSMQTQIKNVTSALDINGDGNIADNLKNLKAQCDSEKTLIDAKADKNDLNTLSTTVASLQGKKLDEFVITDTGTQKNYKLTVTNGALSLVEIK